jgi:hypothetical protein
MHLRKLHLLLPLIAISGFHLAPDSLAQAIADRSRIAGSIPDARPLGEDLLPQRTDGAGTTGGGLAPGAGEDFGEARIVSVLANWEPWQVSLNLGAYYTDNAALTPAFTEDDWYFREGVRASYTPKLIGNLFGFFQLSYDEYQYDKLDFLDFGIMDLSAGAIYVARPLWDTSFIARYRYYRVTDGFSLGDQLFDTHALVFGAQNSYTFLRGQKLIGALEAQIAFASDTEDFARHEYSFVAGHVGEWTPWLTSSLLYRLGYFDYWEFDREDWVQSIDLGLTWTPVDFFSLTTSLSFSTNNSNYDFFDYDAWNAGLVLTATLRF